MEASMKVFREIAFELTQEDIVKKAIHVGEVSQEIEREEASLKALVKERKTEIGVLEKDVHDTLSTILARREVRNVECEVRKNFEGNAIEYIFEDKVVDSRPMDADDRQLELVQGGKVDDAPEEEGHDLDGVDLDGDDDGGPDDGGEPAQIPAAAEAQAPEAQ